MSDTEARRLDLYNRLQEVLGTGPATTLMSHLPASDDLVTKGEFTGFTNGEFAAFKTEMGEFKTEMREFKAEMREFKTEMREFRSEVNQRFDRVFLAVLAGQFVLLAAIISAAALF